MNDSIYGEQKSTLLPFEPSNQDGPAHIDSTYIVNLNEMAMQALGSEHKTREACQLLKHCEQILMGTDLSSSMSETDYIRLKALTMNNLGCYYKR